MTRIVDTRRRRVPLLSSPDFRRRKSWRESRHNDVASRREDIENEDNLSISRPRDIFTGDRFTAGRLQGRIAPQIDPAILQ